MSRSSQLDFAAPWIMLALFAVTVAMLGGASRPDAVQIAALRPLAALFLIPALYHLSGDQIVSAKPLLWFLGLFAGWMAIQLIPLPPSVWQALPDRELVMELDRALGLEGNWRPISFVPSRGWNALASLVVPLAALLLAVSMRATPRMLLLMVAAIGLLDASLGLLQVISGRSSPLYFYAITNRGFPVGIFANENHSAVFSAIAMMVVARLWSSARVEHDPVFLRYFYPVGFVVMLLAALVSGSRAGLVFTVFALLVSAVVGWQGFSSQRRRGRKSALENWLISHPRILLAGIALIVVALIGAFVGLERAPGFADIVAKDAFQDLRWQLWPILEQMIGVHWLAGTGFGSFEEFYHIYEPTALLLPNYVNQAHNDWAQFVIEGGLPAVVLLVLLFIWLARQVFALMGSRKQAIAQLVFWGSVFVILGTASVVDYPLRTPAFQLVAVWLLLTLRIERFADQE